MVDGHAARLYGADVMSGVRIVKKQNGFGKVARAFPEKTSQIIKKVSNDIQSLGQANTPIGPTGNLQNNVVNSYRDGDLKASITWAMDYAAYVHEGTYKMVGRPFAKDAADDVWPSMKQAFESLEKKL